MACVDIPNLPLQLLVRNHPSWKEKPVAVVDRNKQNGMIQYVNERARACHILPGLRYSTGLSLSSDLCAGVVTEAEIAVEITLLRRRLACFSPTIEPSLQEPGIFWLDASGLLCLYPSLEFWAASLRDDLRQAGFESVVVVGFSRFGSYAAAKASTSNTVSQCPEEESTLVRDVPIERLGIDPNLRDVLLKLGIDSLGGFMDLPTTSILARLGPQAFKLYQLSKGNGWALIEPKLLLEPVERTVEFEYPEVNLGRLLAAIKPLLNSILVEFSDRYERLSSLGLSLVLYDGSHRCGRLSPATPTLDTKQLMLLTRTRLQAFSISAGVVDLKIQAIGVSASQRQLQLFREGPYRNQRAVDQTFAALRIEMGSTAVVMARLLDGHLPEARFGWEPCFRFRARWS